MVNNGTLSGSVTVNDELRGSGAVEGAVMVTSTGALIVVNSPGYQSVESLDLQVGSETVFSVSGTVASTAGNTGWGSDTYSQILVTEGELTTLLGNTTFELTDDEAALTGISSPSAWSVSVSDAAYSLSGNNLVDDPDPRARHGDPEPAGARWSGCSLPPLVPPFNMRFLSPQLLRQLRFF